MITSSDNAFAIANNLNKIEEFSGEANSWRPQLQHSLMDLRKSFKNETFV